MNDEEIKAIERLKRDINTPLACGDTTIVIIDDLQTVLNLIEKQKAEIETLKRDFEIVGHECSRLEQEDIRKDLMINLMAKQLADYKYEELICMEIDCRHTEIQNEGKCIGDTNCIKEYFENKVKESK